MWGFIFDDNLVIREGVSGMFENDKKQLLRRSQTLYFLVIFLYTDYINIRLNEQHTESADKNVYASIEEWSDCFLNSILPCLGGFCGGAENTGKYGRRTKILGLSVRWSTDQALCCWVFFGQAGSHLTMELLCKP